jgi:hypothetical protein
MKEVVDEKEELLRGGKERCCEMERRLRLKPSWPFPSPSEISSSPIFFILISFSFSKA